jgi:hypothetical protein
VNENRVEGFVAWCKRNPVVSAAIVIGIVVIALAKFTDSTRMLIGLFQDPKAKTSQKTEAERRIVTEVSHRITRALARLEEDEADLKKGADYRAWAIYHNAVSHLNNSFDPTMYPSPVENVSIYPEYSHQQFLLLLGELKIHAGPAEQTELNRAIGGYNLLTALSTALTEPPSDEERARQALMAVSNATKTIKNDLMGDYLKSALFQ